MLLQKLLIRIVVFVIAVFITDWLIVGVGFQDWMDEIVVGLLLAFINTFIKPILKILTFPITLMTMGLFPLILNTTIILVIAGAIPGFVIFGDWFFTFIWALIFGICLTIVNFVLDSFVKIVT